MYFSKTKGLVVSITKVLAVPISEGLAVPITEGLAIASLPYSHLSTYDKKVAYYSNNRRVGNCNN